MAYNKFEQTYVDAYLNNMYPDVEEEQPQDTMLAAAPTTEPTGQVTVSGLQPQQVRTDVQPEFGVARPIPQNKAQEALGYLGELLTKAGVQLDKVGVDIPVLGRVSLKDLTVGESGKVLEDMALGFYPVEGAGGFVSGTTRIKPDPALELLNLAPLAGVATKVAGKGVVKAGQAVAPKAAEMAEGYLRSIGGIADIAPVGPRANVGNNISELGDALLMAVKVGDKELKIPGDKAAVLQKAIKNLTPEEQGKLRTDTAIKMVDILTTLPSTKEFAAAAVGGVAKKGWYEGSAKAIIEVFGQDAPRFAALLSATSPQTSVESNLYNALQVWKNWTAAGRPQDRESIISVMGQSVQGSKGEESVLDAWKNNSVRALTSEDPSTLTLSGPKVDSFMKNLQGNVDQVTNDAWMASFSLVDQTIFSGSLTKTDAGKGPGYLAMNARVRDTAKYLTKLTGETWTPAEVQETIWSWAKTVYEKSSDVNETRSALQLIKENAITDDLIASTPDFRTLFYDERYAPILEKAGYKDQLDKLRTATATDNAGPGGKKPRSSSETGKALGNTQSKLLESNAKRLDKLRLSREQASAEKALNKQTFDGGE